MMVCLYNYFLGKQEKIVVFVEMSSLGGVWGLWYDKLK